MHNAFSAMGLTQIGSIQEGALRAGAETRLSLPLPAGCVAIVALGGEGIQDLDATLLDAHGSAIAHDTTTESQAVLRPCLDVADTYVLVVKAAAGAGSWVAATWVGGIGASAAEGGAGPSASVEANGTCEAPIPLGPGTVSGSTTHGEHENAGTCGPSDSRELVYELDVTQRARVTIEVEARFDSVLYVRKDDCNDADAEVACSDDAPDRTHSRVERVLEPGKYFVFVDGYGQEAGTFKMTVTTKEVLALSDICRHAASLADGTTQSGATLAMADDAEATCGGGAEGADVPFHVDLAERSRVRLVEHSDEMAPVVHVRRACADAQSEVACGESGAVTGDATITGVFEPGPYTVFADAHDRDAAGRFTLRWEAGPPDGVPTASDACGDAETLAPGATGKIDGDTFNARDDVNGSCGGAGAADVVYRLDVPRRSHLVASLEGQEAPHLLILWRRCSDRSTEIACGPAVSEVVAPGTYFVAVDGAAPDAFGRFSLQWSLRNVTDQDAACARAQSLPPDRPLTSTTVGASDAFDTSCGANGTAAMGPDRVFKLVVARRSTVRIIVKTAGFDASVELRAACADPLAGPLPELSCDANGAGKTTIERTLEAGTYWVVVDGRTASDQGPFTIEYRVGP